MATYKVLQDIEAEDKLLGPLSLRQFIYASIVVVSGFIAFKLIAVSWLLVLPLLPHIFLFGLLAAPFGKDQSSEIWLLAKIRFMLKPQRRIWDQSGIKDLVTITVPKKIEHQLTNGLSENEVKSRLQALANTIDSRGWAVKHVNVNLFAQPSYVLNQVGSDRLLDPTTLPRDVPGYDTTGIEDVLDETNSATAQKFDQLISTSTQARRENIMARMHQQATNQPQANYWFMNSTPQPADPSQAAFAAPAVVSPGLTVGQAAYAQVSKDEEAALLEKIHAKKDQPNPMHSHLKTIDPAGSHTSKPKHQAKVEKKTPDIPVTPATDPAILEYAKRDDLNVATIARQLSKSRPQESDDEVVISLH